MSTDFSLQRYDKGAHTFSKKKKSNFCLWSLSPRTQCILSRENYFFFFTRHHRMQLKYKSQTLEPFRCPAAGPDLEALLQGTSRNAVCRERPGTSSGSLQALLFTRKQTSLETFSPLGRSNLFTPHHRESEKRPYFHD